MPKFVYKAKRGPDDIIEGNMEADSVDTVVEKLNNEGYIPFVIQEGDFIQQKRVEKKISKRKIKSKDINIFTRQLANLLRSKVTLLKAFTIIYEQTENASLRDIVKEIQDSVKEGGMVSDVLAVYPKYFSLLYVNTVRSGEIGCVLKESLERLAEFADKEEEIKTKIRVAIAYPLFMLMTGILTIVVILTFVMPKLIVMFEDIGQDLPVPTQIIIGLSNGMRAYWYLILIGIFALFFLFKKRGMTRKEKYALDRIKLGLPLIGRFARESEVSKFARTLSLLLDNGVSLHRAIDATIPTLSNVIIQNELQKVSESVISGGTFSRALQDSRTFTPFAISMITVGEEGGSLDAALNDVANYYEREGDQAMKIISSMLEPAMILGMGLVIGFIVISMLLPIFELNVLTGG